MDSWLSNLSKALNESDKKQKERERAFAEHITPDKIEDWMDSRSLEYAALTIGSKRLRLMVGWAAGSTNYVVYHGQELVYSGPQQIDAVKAFRSIVAQD